MAELNVVRLLVVFEIKVRIFKAHRFQLRLHAFVKLIAECCYVYRFHGCANSILIQLFPVCLF